MGLGDLPQLIGRHRCLAVFVGVMLESAGGRCRGTVLIADGVLVHEGVLGLGDALYFGIFGA